MNFRVGNQIDRGLTGAAVADADFLPHIAGDPELDFFGGLRRAGEAEGQEGRAAEEDFLHGRKAPDHFVRGA